MRNPAPYLIYLAVLARTAGWGVDSFPVPIPIWILLIVFGVLLATEPALTRRIRWYPRLYALIQSGLAIAMFYIAPAMDILSMLFFPLSFQVVQYFGDRIGFSWIGVFSLAMAGTFFFGMELAPGILMILLGTGSNALMGSYASLIRRTDSSRCANQKMFAELQAAYRTLKDSAAREEQLAAGEERRRLVRELHDSLTQTLFSMNLAVQAAQLSDEKSAPLLRLQDLSRSAAAEVQALVGAAPARTPAAAELIPALRQLVEERRSRDGLNISLEVSGRKELPGLVAANLYRITQEALNNVSRHAGACEVAVRLKLDARPACLEVEDTGSGFDAGARDLPHRFGLTGMEERAREMGWDLEIDFLARAGDADPGAGEGGMSRAAAPDRITTREHPAVRLLGYLIIFTVALRRVDELNEASSIALALGLLGLFTVLYAAESLIARRYAGYPRVYFAAQFFLAQALGIFRDYQDTWALLYVVLAVQAAYRCPRREALAWGALFAASSVITLSAEFGVLSGLGRASAFIVIGLIFILYDSQYAQREDANEESRVLLEELRIAHRKLAENTARAEGLAAVRERDRILRELHDSVGQKVFAIQLAAESTLLLLEKDPPRAAGQLVVLQDQTQAALDQMRQLIEEWKPKGKDPSGANYAPSG